MRCVWIKFCSSNFFVLYFINLFFFWMMGLLIGSWRKTCFFVSFQARHWRLLFASLGQVYDQSYNYLIIDLVSFGLRDHSQQVISICDSVAAEYALEAHLKKLTKKWEEEEFRLMKFFQVSRQGSKVKAVGKDTITSSYDMYILTGVNELQSYVEVCHATLRPCSG